MALFGTHSIRRSRLEKRSSRTGICRELRTRAATPPPRAPWLTPFGRHDIPKQTFCVTQDRNRNRNRAPTTRTAGSSAAGVVGGCEVGCGAWPADEEAFT